MTQRRFDLVLLVGIGILLLVILILALSAAPRQGASDISDPALSVTPLGADGSGDEPAGEAPAAAATETPASQAEPTEQATGGLTTEEPTPAEPAADALPIGRIGFAYATGEAGACGVPLTAWNYVAVSRDLLETYPCGTAITLTLNDEVAGRTEVVAQVGDTMGADITDTVNVFVGQDEPALEYGVTSGTLSP